MIPTRLAIRALLPRFTLHKQLSRRSESTYQPPTPPESSRSRRDRHRDFYKTFGRPLAKNFLIAVATYQVLYFTWLKLESYETKQDGEGELKKVEGELKSLVGAKEK